ncbi:MAG TPA: alpha amylase C-terminal domain-containing protein, partial [Gaiella sp.]|nr:alpha amylase C-terminal domain-containing protein [Gaiella sp.]
CVVNFSPVVRDGWRVPLPRGGRWREVVNTDATEYGGSGVGNLGVIEAQATSLHGRPYSAAMTLPPLAALWLAPEG